MDIHPDSENRVSLLLEKLKQRNALLISVESCTGGLIANRITDVSGSSQVFWGGMIVYDNRFKETLVKVSPEILAEHGAVSAPVAEALASGGVDFLENISPKAKLLYAVSTTGIAGPTGGSAEKPVGLCYVGAAGPRGVVHRKVQAPSGLSRIENKFYFSEQALTLLESIIHD